jgi:2-phospho-L-lactate transferase/gluconeogenesis factor (CofD/UPF0052 family)
MNLMTEPGETDGYTAADHIVAVRRHVPHVPIHDVLLSTTPVADTLVKYYGAVGAAPVPLDVGASSRARVPPCHTGSPWRWSTSPT